MRYAGTERDEDGPWFRLGQLDVTTTVGVLLLWGLTLLVWIVSQAASGYLALWSTGVASGEVWRLVTWPWSHEQFSIFTIINAGIFWLFGTDLERQVGRRSYAALLGASVLIIGLAGTILAQLLSDPLIIADLDLLTLTVVLLYIAEHPTRPFFFGIPAWAIGGVIVALEVVNDLAGRDFVRLLTVFVAAGFIALVARRVELLTNYERVPEVRLPGFGRSGRGGGEKPPKRKRRKDKDRDASGLSAVPDLPPQPTPRPRPQSRPEPVQTADDVALDSLLDKISTGGMDSLSDAERRQLDELRTRRAQRRD